MKLGFTMGPNLHSQKITELQKLAYRLERSPNKEESGMRIKAEWMSKDKKQVYMISMKDSYHNTAHRTQNEMFFNKILT